jgi:hypothetical protein
MVSVIPGHVYRLSPDENASETDRGDMALRGPPTTHPEVPDACRFTRGLHYERASSATRLWK